MYPKPTGLPFVVLDDERALFCGLRMDRELRGFHEPLRKPECWVETAHSVISFA